MLLLNRIQACIIYGNIMSKRVTIKWEISDEYGETQRTVNVVYYSDMKSCLKCKGTGHILQSDSSLNVDNWLYSAPVKEIDNICDNCLGTGSVETVDFKSMTNQEKELFKAYVKDTEKNSVDGQELL